MARYLDDEICEGVFVVVEGKFGMKKAYETVCK